MSEPRKRSEWLTPQNFFTVLAAAWGIYGSFIGFQKDTSVAVGVLQVEVRHLGEQARQNAADIRALRERHDR